MLLQPRTGQHNIAIQKLGWNKRFKWVQLAFISHRRVKIPWFSTFLLQGGGSKLVFGWNPPKSFLALPRRPKATFRNTTFLNFDFLFFSLHPIVHRFKVALVFLCIFLLNTDEYFNRGHGFQNLGQHFWGYGWS